MSITPPSHIQDGRDALPPASGRRSIAFERMWHILHSIDECAAKHGDGCLQPVKDLELIQVENRFLWSTGTLLDWHDPGMATLIMEWAKSLIRRGEMNKSEGRLLVEHVRTRTKPLLERMDKIAREQGLKPAIPASYEPPVEDRPFTPEQAPPQKAPEAPPAKAQKPGLDYDTLLAKLEKRAVEELEARGLRLTLPQAASALLAKPELPEEVESKLSALYLDLEGMDVTEDVNERPPHIQYMQALARRCRIPATLAFGTQESLWKLRMHANQTEAGLVVQYCEKLVFTQSIHPEGLTAEIIDTCLAEDRHDCLTTLLRRRQPGLPERILQRIAVLTTSQETLLALSKRSDLTRKVLQKILKKPLWRAQPEAKAAVSNTLKSNPTARALMSSKGKKSKLAAA